MTRRYAAVLLCLLLSVCSLPAQNELRRAEEERTIKFEEKIHDFGDVLESQGTLTHTFTFRNVSAKPFVVHNVVSSCGCTTPEWTKEPVMPGKDGAIKVTFNNDQGAYPFDKSLTVYVSSLNRPVILRIRGNVVDRKKPLSSAYPVRFGVIGLRQKDFSIGYIDQGIAKADYTQIANVSRKDATVTAAVLSDPAFKLTVTPNPVPAGKTAKLTFTVDPSASPRKMWGRHTFKAGLSVNGQRVPGSIEVTGIIIDNFTELTGAQIADAAVPVVEKSYFEFGEIKAGKVVTAEYTVVNSGKSPLVIHAIDTKEQGVGVTSALPMTIGAGKSGKVTVRFDSSRHDGEMLEVMTVVTNAPSKPIVNLFLTGNIIR